MDWTLRIIIFLLIANLLWSYYLKREIINPKRYYLIDEMDFYTYFVSRVQDNGELSTTRNGRPKWRLPDAVKVKGIYPRLKIIDCATWEEIEND